MMSSSSSSCSSSSSLRQRYQHSNYRRLQPPAVSSFHVRLLFTHLVAAIVAWQIGVFYSQLAADRCSYYYDSYYYYDDHDVSLFSSWGPRTLPGMTLLGPPPPPSHRRRRRTSSSSSSDGKYHFLRRTLRRIREAPPAAAVSSSSSPSSPSSSPSSFPQVPSTLTKLLTDFMTVGYDDFISTFRLGSPLQGPSNPNSLKPSRGSSQVLLLYQTPSRLLEDHQQLQHLAASGLVSGNSSTSTTGSSIGDTTRTCREVKHIVANLFTNIGDSRDRNVLTCTVIVGKTESYHIQKWIRQPKQQPNSTTVDFLSSSSSSSSSSASSSLVPTNRYLFVEKFKSFNGYLKTIPSEKRQDTALRVLDTYYSVLHEALQELQPIADQVAARTGDHGDDKTLLQGMMVIMVCNFGHSELFVNFVCAARANGVDLSKILMFATDPETQKLAESLGVTTFFNKKVFEFIPKRAAVLYGDDRYAQVMLSKSFVTHLAIETGYDFLFQDVDITPYSPDVWNWWASKKTDKGNFDLYFQEDFNSRPEYSPWIANSGSYYAKNNARTRYLFAAFLWQSDMILETRSHQAALHVVMSEHVSQHGLRIKSLQDENEKIPIGWHFTANPPYMRRLISHGKSTALSFHMNWNENKDVKRKLLEQMGDWYLQDSCRGEKSLGQIISANERNVSVASSCCSVKPLIRCNFRDRPSVIPCRDSPSSDNGNKPSFW